MVEFTTSLLTTETINKAINLEQINEELTSVANQQQTTDSSILIQQPTNLTNTPTLPKNYHCTENNNHSPTNAEEQVADEATNANTIWNDFSDCELISTKIVAQHDKQISPYNKGSSLLAQQELLNYTKANNNNNNNNNSLIDRNDNCKEKNSEIATSSSGILSSTSEAFFNNCDNNIGYNFIRNFAKEDITNSEIFKNIQDFFISGSNSSGSGRCSDIKSRLDFQLGEEGKEIEFAQQIVEINNQKEKQLQDNKKSVLLLKLQQQLSRQQRQPISSCTSDEASVVLSSISKKEGDQNLIEVELPVVSIQNQLDQQSQEQQQHQHQNQHQQRAENNKFAESAPEAFSNNFINSSFNRREITDNNNIYNNNSENKTNREINNLNDLGFQLRALNEKDISSTSPLANVNDPWSINLPTTLSINSQITSTLSTELVNETLNYFVNCRQRLSQMTKTYDDNDAYIYLLQEKEVDLELAARIGQDLLKQNKKLKENIEQLQEELSKKQDDVQQLKHELNSKTTLLDTFIEEEREQQHINNSSFDSEDEFTFKQSSSIQFNSKQPSTSTSQTSKNQQHSDLIRNKASINESTSFEIDEECSYNGFLSLDAQQRPASDLVEPFSSLPHYLSTSESRQQLLLRDDSSSVMTDTLETTNINSNSTKQRLKNQEVLAQTVTFQLVESNKRLCELQDELFYKSEQNVMQQENVFKLQEQLRESERRLCDFASENETLQKSIQESLENQKEICDELKVYKRNFSELLRVFLELQKEIRYYKNYSMQNYCQNRQEQQQIDDFNNSINNNNNNFFDPMIGEISSQNISFDFFNNKNYETTSKITTSRNFDDILHHNCTTNISYDDNHQSAIDGNRGSTINNQKVSNDFNDNNNYIPTNSITLLEELQMASRNSSNNNTENNNNYNGHLNSADEGDSGVHTNTTPVANRSNSEDIDTDNSDESTTSSRNSSSIVTNRSNEKFKSYESNSSGSSNIDENEVDKSSLSSQQQNKRTWIGLSSFMLTTILILYLSVTLSSTPNPTVPVPKLQLSKWAR